MPENNKNKRLGGEEVIIIICCNNYKTFNDFFGLEKQMKIYSISPPGDKLTRFLHIANKNI